MAATTTNSSSSVDNINDCPNAGVVKGKRTQRLRLPSCYLPVAAPAAAAATPSSTSGSGAVDEEDDEDMANCLILLAQGQALKKESERPRPDGGGGVRSERCTSRRLAEAATATSNGKVSFYVYECKTCSKCFPSFQALGGHRSSHKKIKMSTLMASQDQKIIKPSDDRELLGLHLGVPGDAYSHPSAAAATSASTAPIYNNNNSTNVISTTRSKVHECSICGAEYSSGQALGGHMRRHRAEPAIPPLLQGAEDQKAGVVVLPLDLNLPAPGADDDVDDRGGAGDLAGRPPSSFGFRPAPTKRPLVFSPSSLVDCHY